MGGWVDGWMDGWVDGDFLPPWIFFIFKFNKKPEELLPKKYAFSSAFALHSLCVRSAFALSYNKAFSEFSKGG